jgi:hypothetical protein
VEQDPKLEVEQTDSEGSKRLEGEGIPVTPAVIEVTAAPVSKVDTHRARFIVRLLDQLKGIIFGTFRLSQRLLGYQ